MNPELRLCAMAGNAERLFNVLETGDNVNCKVHHLSHVMRLWYLSSSVNSFFKRPCAAIHLC